VMGERTGNPADPWRKWTLPFLSLQTSGKARSALWTGYLGQIVSNSFLRRLGLRSDLFAQRVVRRPQHFAIDLNLDRFESTKAALQCHQSRSHG